MNIKNYILYQAHVLSNSKYYLLFKVMFVFTIYCLYYTNSNLFSESIVYCMTTEPEIENIPIVAEEKAVSTTRDIHRIINSYIEPAREIEQLRTALAEEKARSTNYYDAAGRFQADYNAQKLINDELASENKLLIEQYDSTRDTFDTRRKAYEDLINKLTKKINKQEEMLNRILRQRKGLSNMEVRALRK